MAAVTLSGSLGELVINHKNVDVSRRSLTVPRKP